MIKRGRPPKAASLSFFSAIESLLWRKKGDSNTIPERERTG